VHRVVDPETRDFEIVRYELANPTGLLAEVMRECIEPLQRSLGDIVRELLGPQASERHVRLCQMSILAQCFHPMMRERQRRLRAMASGSSPRHPEFTVEEMAAHVARFSLAGVREFRRLIEEGEADGRK